MKTINLPAHRMPAAIARLLSQPILMNAARIALISPFLISGLLKLFNFQEALAEVTALQLQPAVPFAAAIIVTQLSGSALFMSRDFCWLGAGILCVFTVIATFIAHPFWTFPEAERGRQIATFFEHAAIVGGFVTAAVLVHQRKKV